MVKKIVPDSNRWHDRIIYHQHFYQLFRAKPNSGNYTDSLGRYQPNYQRGSLRYNQRDPEGLHT